MRNVLRTWIAGGILLPVGDLFFGQRLVPRLRFLRKAQWWDRERIRERRDADLRSLIAVAYREVPFYRELMDRENIRPERIRTAEDFRRLPVVTKAMLRRRYPGDTTRATGRRTYEACTSGSTGEGFRIREDAPTAGRYRASFLLALEWAGWRIGEPHLQTGMTLDRDLQRRLKDFLMGCRYVSAFRLDDESLDRALEIIERQRIDHLWGYPGSLYFLARRARRLGWNRPLRTAVTWGDMLYPRYRRTIEETFGVRVTDTYGCAEGFQVAAQCGADSGYHVHDLDIVLELLDDDGREVAPGETGHVVVTRLHPGPMPLIRYRVGDLARRGPEEPCSCGRGFGRLDSVLGRETDVVVTPEGNRLIVHFFTGILEHFSEIESFQVVQEEPSSILLRIVPEEGYSAATAEAVRKELRDRGAGGLRIEIECVKEIPLAETGKRRFVISRLDPSAVEGEGSDP